MVQLPIEILIIDDEKDFVEMLSMHLTEEGHHVRGSFSGPEGLTAMEAEEPDVVILDLKMPGMDGIEVLNETKARFPLVEVILLTGHGTIDTAVTGMKQGAFDYLLKPADHDELMEKLAGARKRKYEHELRIRKAEARALSRRTGGLM
jgi:DNA-binding NtrC family response regulator